MAADPFEATVVKFPGQVVKFFDAGLVGAIGQELPGSHFAHLCLYVPYQDEAGKERVEHVTIGHETFSEQKTGKMAITAERPETLSKIVAAVKKFTAAK